MVRNRKILEWRGRPKKLGSGPKNKCGIQERKWEEYGQRRYNPRNGRSVVLIYPVSQYNNNKYINGNESCYTYLG